MEQSRAGQELSSALLPVGQKSTLDPTGLVRLLPAAAREGELMHSLLAVMHCGKDIENESAKVTEMIAEARERCVELVAS